MAESTVRYPGYRSPKQILIPHFSLYRAFCASVGEIAGRVMPLILPDQYFLPHGALSLAF
jgi:hypothetical protein